MGITTSNAYRAGGSFDSEAAGCHITGWGGVCGGQNLRGQPLSFSQQPPCGNVSLALQAHPISKAETVVFM